MSSYWYQLTLQCMISTIQHSIIIFSHWPFLSLYYNTTGQWRGNYFRTGGARPRARKSGTRNRVPRWKWIVFLTQKQVFSKKKGLHRNWSVLTQNKAFSNITFRNLETFFGLKNGPGYKSEGGKSRPGGGAKLSPGGQLPPHFPRLCDRAIYISGTRQVQIPKLKTIFQNKQIFNKLYNTSRSSTSFFEFDGPTLPNTLYLACECIPSSTIIELHCFYPMLCIAILSRSSDMSKLLWIPNAKWLNAKCALVREVWSLSPGTAKIYTGLQTVCHRFNMDANSCVAFGAMTRRWAPPTRYTLQRNITNKIKGWFGFGNKNFLSKFPPSSPISPSIYRVRQKNKLRPSGDMLP